MASRRKLLQGALLLGGAWAVMARPWTWGQSPVLAFVPLDGRAPFRRLVGGEVSIGAGSSVALIGLDTPDPVDPELDARLRGDLTAVLWGDWDGSGPVPVTYFTDIRCPICRVLEVRLAALEGIALTTREFPVFGETSDIAARAILSAARQGQGEALRARLMRAPVQLTRGYLEVAVGGLPLDQAEFFADFDGPQVRGRLAGDRALGRIFGLPGTPGLVIGRSVVIGLQSAEVLRAIVDEEQRAGRV